MKYYLLGSGSSGNCTALVNDNNEILLIDCGLSYADIQRRLNKCGLDIKDVKKMLITHMHTDHVASIRAFEPDMIYINSFAGMSEFHQFEYYEELDLLGFKVYTLPASHDSPGTTGFLITYGNEKMAYITDTGYIHQNIQRVINNCDIYCIESNHDPRLLMLTKRPQFLKNRILSANGHMSNQDCSYVLGNIIGPLTKEIVFLHRSKEANTEDMVLETFYGIMEKMNVDVSKIKINIAKQNEPISYLDFK